jgi:hypothetical protein
MARHDAAKYQPVELPPMPFLWSVDDPKITARPMRGLDKSAKTKKKKKKKQSKAKQGRSSHAVSGV